MSGLKRLIQEEPAAVFGFVQATITCLVLFGLNLTDEQVAGLLSFTTVTLAFLARAMVTPVVNVDQQVAEGVRDAAEDARAKAIVSRAMSPALTAEEWASVQELRATRDTLEAERRKHEASMSGAREP